MANKNASKSNRKWNLALMVLFISTIILLLPTALLIFFHIKVPQILSGTEFVSIVSICVTAYFAGNVWQRKVELNEGVDSYNSGKIDDPQIEESDIGKEA